MCDIFNCLPSFTMCNGIGDCPNGNDELDCPRPEIFGALRASKFSFKHRFGTLSPSSRLRVTVPRRGALPPVEQILVPPLVGVEDACETSKPLNMSGSIFSSPNFPAPNTDLTPCSLSASAPPGERVVITFTAFDSYDPDLGCLFELSIHEPFLGTVMEANCGSSIPPPVVSTSNTLGIFYSTYGKEFRQGKGFEASVKFVNQSDLEELQCEYSVFFDEGYLTSPGFPELYPNNFECVYSIVAPPGQIVRLSFTSFNVEDHSSCDFDNLSENSWVDTFTLEIPFIAYIPRNIIKCDLVKVKEDPRPESKISEREVNYGELYKSAQS
ncbi:Bone morphogenetic protein 1 [Holothuria leucospilota]|uniref:Bone morphogenetic protein 1 n=1 Tax=Holothuria leucospilota TaxID=206669 RepID=A0A9Q1HBP2_HOLLE|nr:Bone morphogenetic protein 1 [Holothuria leucospilota]